MTEPLIHVGILTENKIQFELYGDFSSEGFDDFFSGIFTATVENGKILCKSGKTKIEISDEIIFNPENPSVDSFIVKDVIIGVKFHWERKERQRFTGSFKLLRVGDKITLINILSIEYYLTSVISSEMSAKCTLNLLKAHAIVSRSWLIAQIEKSKQIKNEKKEYKKVFENEDERIIWYDREDHENFDVCADDHCQRYQGITKVFTSIAREAVKQTRGIVVEYNGKTCDTRYSKSCGGISETFENVWEPTPLEYLKPVIDYKYEPENFNFNFSSENNATKWIIGKPPAFCNTSDKKILSQILLDYDQETKDFYRWQVEYSQEEIQILLKNKLGIDFGVIKDLIPVERGLSSRLIKLKIVGTNKVLTIGKELEIRRALSLTHLYSSAIVIEKYNIKEEIPEKFIIKGAGWGHGVGLCQIGAAVMAEQGYKFDEILLHYFKNARLKKIY